MYELCTVKKLLIYFSFFAFHFLPCNAQQDTAINNRKQADTKSKNKQQRHYLLLSAGFSHPWTFSGYGASSYYSSEDGYGYSGYANDGYEISATGGMLIGKRGWELSGAVSYIRNRFDAGGVMTETISNFGLGVNVINIYAVNAIGNYAYSNFPILAGITKNWGSKGDNGRLGISFLFGEMLTYTPAMHGVATGLGGYQFQNTVSYYFNMNSEVQANFIFELKLHIDVNINPHFFIRLAGAFGLSGLTNSGGYQFADMPGGKVIASGNYTGSAYQSSSFFVGLTDATIGLGYRL